MKDFVIKDFDRFLEIADTISTPFKFVEATESDVGEEYQFVEARVWMRTAYISWKTDAKKEEVKEIISNLKRHGFSEMELSEVKVGDKVYTWYYGIRQIGLVVAIRGKKARVRFTNESGWQVEHWRPISTLKKLNDAKGEVSVK